MFGFLKRKNTKITQEQESSDISISSVPSLLSSGEKVYFVHATEFEVDSRHVPYHVSLSYDSELDLYEFHFEAPEDDYNNKYFIYKVFAGLDYDLMDCQWGVVSYISCIKKDELPQYLERFSNDEWNVARTLNLSPDINLTR